ncbi:MAG: Rrf2 family transcriptional regulator [Rhodospirillales bacterium]|nr:Rrf2 family transcriptional regulator [Rhodospirillales bacterium]
MRLTHRTDYALRVLMYLAVNGEGLATISEIAGHYGISRNHVARVVWELGRADFVETVRGRGGGLRLARAAETISVGATARCTEGTIPLAEHSPGGADSLPITSRCIYREVLAQAGEAFFVVLDRYTVGDLVKGNRRLRAGLSSNTPR